MPAVRGVKALKPMPQGQARSFHSSAGGRGGRTSPATAVASAGCRVRSRPTDCRALPLLWRAVLPCFPVPGVLDSSILTVSPTSRFSNRMLVRRANGLSGASSRMPAIRTSPVPARRRDRKPRTAWLAGSSSSASSITTTVRSADHCRSAPRSMSTVLQSQGPRAVRMPHSRPGVRGLGHRFH